jgi:hypothetical protein
MQVWHPRSAPVNGARAHGVARPALFTNSYRSVSAIYPIGYDPLPYRFGYFPEPYRYRHRVTMLTARPYRYYWRYPQGKPAGVNRQA